MLYHSPHVTSNKAAEPQRESALALGLDSKKVNKHRSVHFSSDSKAMVCSVILQKPSCMCQAAVSLRLFYLCRRRGYGQGSNTRLLTARAKQMLSSRHNMVRRFTRQQVAPMNCICVQRSMLS